MRVVIRNDIISISGADKNIESEIKKHLSYVDKSKQFQLNRLKRNPFTSNSPYVKQLEKEVKGFLWKEEGNDLIIPAGFHYLLSKYDCEKIDERHSTGETISLPWRSQSKIITLRNYQQEAVDLALNNWRGIINISTGLGKTKLAICLVRLLKRKALIVCPSKTIAYQFYQELIDTFDQNKIGFIGDGKYKPSAVTVGIAASVCNRIDEIKKLDLGVIIFDETHHTPASTFYTIADGLGAVGRMYGLTATAFRSDGKDIFIHASCGDILIQRDAAWGVENGFLSRPYFIVRSIKTDAYDYKNDKLKSYKAHVLDCKIMNDRIISDVKAFSQAGKNVLVLVDQIEHGDMIAEALNIAFANGRDKGSEKLIDDFNVGKISSLIATDGLVGEGVDTRNVEVLFLVNFMASKSAVLQAVGRGLRKTDTKDTCIILDYKPLGSSLLSRHCDLRISYYMEITNKIKIV